MDSLRSPLTPDVRPVDLKSGVHLGTVALPKHGGVQRSALRLHPARSNGAPVPSSRCRTAPSRLAALQRSRRSESSGSFGAVPSRSPAAFLRRPGTESSRSSQLYGNGRAAKVLTLLTASHAHQSPGLPDPSYRPYLPSQPPRPASRSLTPALTSACSGLAALATDARR